MRKSSSSLMFMGVMFFIMGMILVGFSLMFYMTTGSGSIFLFVGISSIFLISGILSFIKGINSKRIIKRVLAMNFIIQAQIVDFRRGYLSSRIPTYILKASAISPSDGKKYIFKSDAILHNLTPILHSYNITKVPVYVNPQNYNEYYVDMKFFQQYLGKKYSN